MYLKRAKENAWCGERRPRLLGVVEAARRLGQAEVHQLDASLGCHHDVLRLDVTMDDTVGVCVGERFGQLDGEVECLAFALASSQAIGEGLAVQPLHHQIIDVPIRSDLEQRADVRMIEPGRHLRFVPEAFTTAPGGRRLRIEDLDGDLAPEPWVGGEVDLAHTSASKNRDNDVRTDRRTRGQRQERHYSDDAPSVVIGSDQVSQCLLADSGSRLSV